MKKKFNESLKSLEWSHSVVVEMYKELLPVIQDYQKKKLPVDLFVSKLFAMTQVYHNGNRNIIGKTFLDQHLGTGWAKGVWKQLLDAKMQN